MLCLGTQYCLQTTTPVLIERDRPLYAQHQCILYCILMCRLTCIWLSSDYDCRKAEHIYWRSVAIIATIKPVLNARAQAITAEDRQCNINFISITGETYNNNKRDNIVFWASASLLCSPPTVWSVDAVYCLCCSLGLCVVGLSTRTHSVFVSSLCQ